MEENIFLLIHRDDPVVMVSIDFLSGSILRVGPKCERELLPPGGSIDAQTLRKWWQRRAVPVNQGEIGHILVTYSHHLRKWGLLVRTA